jgi:NADH-quinone oxidoreductase subunit C
MKLKTRATVVVPIDSANNPEIESVTKIWPGAGWLERETYDMLGIKFLNNPDPRRMLLPEAFVGHPLRKDFIVDYRQKFPEVSEEDEAFDPFGHNIVRAKESGV